MAQILVQHTLSSSKTVKFNLNLRKYSLKDSYGESVWLLEIGTTEPDKDGKAIKPRFVHKVTDSNLEEAVNKAIAEQCALINWGELNVDRYPPIISDYGPTGSNVPITSKVLIIVKDESPASGIDLSNLSVTLNTGAVDFDITSEIIVKGDPYEYALEWTPTILYR